MSLNCISKIVIFFSFLFSQYLCAQPSKLDCKKLVVGGADNWYPYAFVDESNVSQGIGFDIIKMISSDINIPLIFKTGLPWNRTIAEVNKGNIDILSANYWTKERNKSLLMSHEISSESLHVFSLKKSSLVFEKWIDLIGYQGVMPRGMALGEAFSKFTFNVDLKEVNTHSQIFKMLNTERVDYIILAKKSAQPYLSLQENKNIKMHRMAINLYSVRISFSRKSRCIGVFEHFNKQLKDRIDDGSIARIIAKYPQRVD